MALNSSSRGPNAYHHGDLRAALVAAARETLETNGPEKFSLKALATKLGVTQPAPYRHFSNRDALLVAVATDGFALLLNDLKTAVALHPLSQHFEQACLAYLAFGRSHPGLYRLMFATEFLGSTREPTLRDAAKATFDLLLIPIERSVPSDQVNVTGVALWSALHGMVMLEAEGIASASLEEPVLPVEVVRRLIWALTVNI